MTRTFTLLWAKSALVTVPDSELGRGSHLFRVMQDQLGGGNEMCTILPEGNLAQMSQFSFLCTLNIYNVLPQSSQRQG